MLFSEEFLEDLLLKIYSKLSPLLLPGKNLLLQDLEVIDLELLLDKFNKLLLLVLLLLDLNLSLLLKLKNIIPKPTVGVSYTTRFMM